MHTPDRGELAPWVVAQVPRGRRVVRVNRLTGGLTSEVTAWSVEDARGRVHRLVLRRWTGEPWPDGAVDDGRVLVPREQSVLQALERVGVPAPRVVAADPAGESAGLPALLMTRLPGRLDLTPADPEPWTWQLAEQLARIHDLEPWPGLAPYESWLRVPPQLAAVQPPPDRLRFVHHDFQPFNVLWSRGRVAGVVDWVWASAGPADGDVAHCRMNLCLLHGVERAVAFQSAYESLTGRRLDPWWDEASLVDGRRWRRAELQKQAGRRLRLRPEAEMQADVEELLARRRRAG